MRLTLIRLELAASTLLIGVAAGWSALRGLDLGGLLRPSVGDVALGVGFGLALAVMLPMITAPWARRIFLLRGLRQAWDVLESGLGPGLTTAEVLVLALGAALSEELFFRGVVQAELGLPVASLLFGLLHPLGLAYVVWATVAGVGLGVLCTMTGSLVAPAAAHGTYNLLALVYLRRRSQR
jgi:membrane protease YdiL (CAAX protease family)